MKIVFEFRGKPQVVFNGYYYSGRFDEPPEYRGGRVEGLIVDCIDYDRPGHESEGDTLYLEGDIESLRSAFRDALDMLDTNEEMWKRSIVDLKAHAAKCDICGGWYDTRRPQHSDGRGMGCNGDGTVMLGERLIKLIRDGQDPQDWNISSLLPGQRFVIVNPIGDYEKREFVVLDNPVKERSYWQVKVSREPESK